LSVAAGEELRGSSTTAIRSATPGAASDHRPVGATVQRLSFRLSGQGLLNIAKGFVSNNHRESD
jgi:hypothetical protein